MRMKIVTFKINEESLKELDTFCYSNGLSRSAVIRIAIKQYINEHKKQKRRIKVVEII